MAETTLTNYKPDADPDKIETITTLRGVRGRMTINKSTGQSTFNLVESDGSTGDLLASSDGNAWEPTDRFTRQYQIANPSGQWALDINVFDGTNEAFREQQFFNGPTTKNAQTGKWESRNSLMYELNSTREASVGQTHYYKDEKDRKETLTNLYNKGIQGGETEEYEINSAGEQVLISNPTTHAQTVTGPPGATPPGDPIDFTQAAGRQVDGKREVLRYPLKEPPSLGYDYIKITAYKYKPPGLKMVGMNGVDYGGDFRIEGEPFETVILPMQPNITESNSTSWNEDQMNAIEGAMGTMASGLIESLADAGLGQFGDAGTTMGATFRSIADQITAVMKDPATKPGIIAYFAGQAIGKNIMGRASGQVINPNLELLFNGPRLRTFNFNFTFTPREEKEAEVIRKIIRAFKRNMAPQRSTSNLFLLSPRVFKLKYIYNNRAEEDKPNDSDGSQHPYLDRFKTCALTAFNVNYTPGGSYATYKDGGSMTQYKVDMSFNELNPIYADEYQLDTKHMGYG